MKKSAESGPYTNDDGFESLRSNATSSSDNNEESKVPKHATTYLLNDQYKSIEDNGDKNTRNLSNFVPTPLGLTKRRQSEPNLVYRTETESLVSFISCLEMLKYQF